MPTLDTTQQDAFTIAYTDAKGNAVTPAAGSVTLATSDATIATVTADNPTDTAGHVTSVAAGTVTLTATGPSGPIALTGDTSYTITAAAPVAGTVSAAAPTTKP